jgi:hypothetical protein
MAAKILMNSFQESPTRSLAQLWRLVSKSRLKVNEYPKPAGKDILLGDDGAELRAYARRFRRFIVIPIERCCRDVKPTSVSFTRKYIYLVRQV